MNWILSQIVLVVIGLVIFAGLYIGYPGKGLRSAIIVIALVVAAAFLLAVFDRVAHLIALVLRHCERSEAIQSLTAEQVWIALSPRSSQ
jgi:hypothetical protein